MKTYWRINRAEWRSKLFLLPYFLMLIIGLTLPSDGNHGLFTPKSLSFLLCVGFFIFYFLAKRSASMQQIKILGFMFSMVSLLLIWLAVGVMTDHSNWHGTFDQFKVFVITLSVAIVTLYVVSERLATPQKILRCIIFANFAYSLFKMILVTLHTLKIVSMFSIMEKLGMRFMTMEMAGPFSRFQTSVDVVTPFLIFFVLQSDNLGLGLSKRFRFFFCLVSAISILFSFSRFLMGVGFMAGTLHWITTSPKQFLKGLALVVVLLGIFVAVVGVDIIGTIIYRRFFSNDNYLSDVTRVQQIQSIMKQFFEAPYWGQGLGGYVKEMIRDGGLTYSYEVQWVAFLMQFGLIGFTLLMIPVGLISWNFVLGSFTRVRWGFFGLFLIWLFSGFTNPFLISLASGIVYSMFLLAGEVLSSPKQLEGACIRD